ncbi:MAG: C4-type zinc ribbon domain-containing protein [Nitrospirota bacterium]
MNPQLQPLIELQTLDLRIGEIREHQRKAPDLLSAAEAPLRDATAMLKDATAATETLGKERRDRERDLEAQEAQIEKLKGRLSELKTNKEYQAHLFEIEMANKKKGEIEEQILVLMERIEAQQRALKEAKAKVADAERLFAQEKARLEAESAGLVTELAQLEQKQATLATTLDRELLDRYGKLKAMRKDLAVVPVKNGTCSGCRLQLPPQLVAEVKRSDEMNACPYCHRILYWDGEPVSVSTSQPRQFEEEETV